MSVSKIGLLIPVGLLEISLFVWEHIARKKNSRIKPSVLFNYLATKSSNFFKGAGYYIAKISSFYTYINLSDLMVTGKELTAPIVQLCVSPYKLIKGYWDKACEYKYAFLVVAGSASFMLVSLLLYKYEAIPFILNNLNLNLNLNLNKPKYRYVR